MHFIRLIRPINLLIIVLSMYGVVFYLERIQLFSDYNYNVPDFYLLVLSTVMIAAAGNIINDYFDVRADRINKPEKLIITKHIKRRWAIVSHWILNGLAFLIGVYLSIKYETFIFVFIHLLTINLLWFYSMYFKRKVLTGNLIIAFLTSLVPILSLIFMYFSPGQHNDQLDLTTFNGILDSDFIVIHVVAFFAFIQNFAREIVKDIEDVEGDKLIYVKSLPMVIGIKKTLFIVIFLLTLLPSFLIVHYFSHPEYSQFPDFNKLYFFIIAALLNLIVIVMILGGFKQMKALDRLIKVSMLFGILSLYQLALIL